MACKCGHKKTDHDYRDDEHLGKCNNKRLVKPNEPDYKKNINLWIACNCEKYKN